MLGDVVLGEIAHEPRALAGVLMMKLTELNPRFYTWYGESARIGVTFDCPVHRDHRVFVPFANPLDGGKPEKRTHLWQRSGDTFDTLTVSPSVDYTRYDTGAPRDATCWHGFIRNGEVT